MSAWATWTRKRNITSIEIIGFGLKSNQVFNHSDSSLRSKRNILNINFFIFVRSWDFIHHKAMIFYTYTWIKCTRDNWKVHFPPKTISGVWLLSKILRYVSFFFWQKDFHHPLQKKRNGSVKSCAWYVALRQGVLCKSPINVCFSNNWLTL